MGPLAVVDPKPSVGQGAQLRQGFEEVRVQHLGPVAPIETFDIGVVKSRQLQLMPTLRIELFASRIPSIL